MSRPSFVVKDCALLELATGQRARDLRELRDRLAEVDPASIYHHFWGGRMRPSFDDPEYNNDFAAWAYHGLHDRVLAERLSMVDPVASGDIEQVREDLLERIEDRLDELDVPPWSQRDRQFHFGQSQLVLFETGRRVDGLAQLPPAIAEMTDGSLFYHFIDARRRTEGGVDDFRAWLATQGEEHEPLRARIGAIDPYFTPFEPLRALLQRIVGDHVRKEAP